MRSLHITVVLLFSSLLIVPAGWSQTKILKPLNPGNKILVSESGHTGAYYLLNADNPSYILVKGPGKFQVITRAVTKLGDRAADYSIFYRVDGSKLLKQDYNSIATSNTASIKLGITGSCGVMRTLEFELGPGEHSLEFTTGSTGSNVIAKYLFRRIKQQKVKWVMLSPSRPHEPVDLVTHEDVIHYYRFSQNKPLKIRINGPTTLRILTRFENHYNMKGRIDYRVQIKEDGMVIHTYLLSSIYSEVTTYRKNDKLIPGKACEFFIEVPSGRHNYTVIPLDKDKNTILARVLFPKKDVNLEE